MADLERGQPAFHQGLLDLSCLSVNCGPVCPTPGLTNCYTSSILPNCLPACLPTQELVDKAKRERTAVALALAAVAGVAVSVGGCGFWGESLAPTSDKQGQGGYSK